MRKFIYVGLAISAFVALPVWGAVSSDAVAESVASAQTTTSAESSSVPGGVVSKSELVTHIDTQLSENIIHSNVLNYTQPAELASVASRCLQVGPDECLVLYKAYENSPIASVAARANLELAVLSLQRGQLKQALAYVERAGQLEPEDPFVVLTKGWILLSSGKYKKARQAFADMLYLTADFEYASSAKLGTALAFYLEGDLKAAAKDFQYIYTSNPYLISFSAYMMGRIAAKDKSSRKLSTVFLEQALNHDAHNYPALAFLAGVSEQNKAKALTSFQYYATLYSIDPTQKNVWKKLTRYATKLNKQPADYLFNVSLDQPIVQDAPSVASDTVEMALYADRWQNPVALQKVLVMPSGVLTIQDEKLGTVLKSPSFVTRILEFNPQNNSIDIKDSRGHVEFSTRRPFVLRLEKSRKTLLVKEVVAEDVFATDFSDKELKGELKVVPTNKGMLLVNKTQVEDLMPALLATQAQTIHQESALRALAVVFRAALQEAAKRPTDKPYQITDNEVYFKFKGINLTTPAITKAVQESRGLKLSNANLGYYASCGVVTQGQVRNSKMRPDYQYSPANVIKYMLSNPPSDLYSAPSDPTQWSQIKWVYLYEGKDIENRLNDRATFGRLRAMRPLKMSKMGRVISMEFKGSKGDYVTDTEQETAYILSAGTMRSTFFDFVPLYKGKNIKSVLVRGYDTGTGVGLCVAGAEGLARNGADYQAIIKYYFPTALILDTKTGVLH